MDRCVTRGKYWLGCGLDEFQSVTVQTCPQVILIIHKHAKVLIPSMFMAQLPQMPSRQLLRKVNVGSTSFLILINASNTMGPVLFRSRV